MKRFTSLLLCLALLCVLAVMPAAAESQENPFADISADDWFYSYALACAEADLMTGTSATQFSPNDSATRAQIVTVLYRLEEEPAPVDTSFFPDVTANAWYTDAVEWAAGAGIAEGYEDGTFRPNRAVTRQEFLTLLYRYALGNGLAADNPDLSVLNRFPDVGSVADWALDAEVWSVAIGLQEGTLDSSGNVLLNPSGNLLRSELATFLVRFLAFTEDGGPDEPMESLLTDNEVQPSQVIDVSVTGTTGTLTLYNQDSETWSVVLSVGCYVGKNGITDSKAEGDGKTPIGLYSLGQAFGVAADPGSSRPYLQVTSDHYWVDDSNSIYYNQLVDVRQTSVAWNSAEHLVDYPDAYRYAIAIDYNTEGTPGAGSAIFLHCSTGGPTNGCVSVSENAMITILQSLREDTLIYIH